MAWEIRLYGYDRERVPMAGSAEELPATFEAVAVPDADEIRPGYAFEFEVVDGVPRCREVRVTASEHGREVLRKDLEGIKLENWVEQISIAMRAPVGSVRYHVPTGSYRVLPLSQELFGRLLRTVRQARRNGGRRGPTDEQLRQALDVYQSADRAPTRAVSEHFGISHRTASLWIARAKGKDNLS